MIGAISPSLPATGHWGAAPRGGAGGRRVHRRPRRPALEVRALPPARRAADLAGPRPRQRLPDLRGLRGARSASCCGCCRPRAWLVPREHPAIRAIAGETAARIVWYDTEPCDGWYPQRRDLRRDHPLHPGGPRRRRARADHHPAGRAQHREHRRRLRPTCWSAAWSTRPRWPAAVASFDGIRRRLDRLTTASARAGDRGLRLAPTRRPARPSRPCSCTIRPGR